MFITNPGLIKIMLKWGLIRNECKQKSHDYSFRFLLRLNFMCSVSSDMFDRFSFSIASKSRGSLYEKV